MTCANVESFFVLLGVFALTSGVQMEAMVGGMKGGMDEASPVQKVVSLLQDMKTQVEKEADKDEAAHKKYGCWCTTNKDAKTVAVAAAEKRIVQLEAFLEEVAGTKAQLKTQITGLEADIAEDQDALSAATSIREKETAEFQVSEKDQKETIETLKNALKVLEKVQLLQHRRLVHSASEDIKPLLLQLGNSLSGIKLGAHVGVFRGVMQRDLWDMMSSIDEGIGGSDSWRPAGEELSAIEQHWKLSVGQDPSGLNGNAAGAASYNARSGGIFGMLSEMRSEFEKTLAADQKVEMQAMIAYHKLRSAKVGEIASAQASAAEKQQMLADAHTKEAQSKEDIAATKDAFSADQQFLLGLEQNCASNVEDYAERAKTRSEELLALAQTIKILTTDDARDLYVKTMALLQLGKVRRGGGAGRGREAAEARARNFAVETAMQRILRVAQKNRNWLLASLAVHVRLDAFSKVKEAMDKMVLELRAQQQEEAEKKDFCVKQIDETEDNVKEKANAQDDLEGRQLGLENSIASLETDLAELHAEVKEMKQSLKRAGQDRSAENKIFQQAVTDQRATAAILIKAKARLAKFYTKQSASLAQGSAKDGRQPNVAKPGQPVAPPPPKPQAYAKSGGAGVVMQLLDIILADAAKEEAELLRSEQHAQSSYEAMVTDINEAIGADEAAIVDKSKLSSQAASKKSEAETALLANEQERAKLDEALAGMHSECDYILKYFSTRQQARQDELDAIADAKAVLSGADFQ